MRRRWNQTLATPGPEWAAPIPAAPAELSSPEDKPMGEGKGKHPTSSTRQEFPMTPLDPNNNNANP